MLKHPPIVVNEKDYRQQKDERLLPIGRGTRYGNYAIHKQHLATRNAAVVGFVHYLVDKLRNGELTLDDIYRLSGRLLACYCKPKLCHGDILVICYNTLFEMTHFDHKIWLAERESILVQFTKSALAYIEAYDQPTRNRTDSFSEQQQSLF